MSALRTKLRALRIVTRTLLDCLAAVWFTFALLSGAAQQGPGIGGVVQNVPNTLPWLALSAIVFIAFKWELIGGILTLLAGEFSALKVTDPKWVRYVVF